MTITRFESLVTFVLTKPNGFMNKSFAQSPTVQKLYERMDEEVWQNQKTQMVRGYFVQNESR